MSDQVTAPAVRQPGMIRRLVTCAGRHWKALALLAGGGVVGLIAMGSWVKIIEHTNHTEFCISCHIMRDTVYEEYKKSVHYSNRHGVRVGCPDCHVPQYDLIDEAIAKVSTITELYAFFFQGINTGEALLRERPELAKQVWAKFAASNARECKHCHQYSGMQLEEQKPSARVSHTDAGKKDQNCVECHRGITHQLPPSDKPAKDSDNFDVD